MSPAMPQFMYILSCMQRPYKSLLGDVIWRPKYSLVLIPNFSHCYKIVTVTEKFEEAISVLIFFFFWEFSVTWIVILLTNKFHLWTWGISRNCSKKCKQQTDQCDSLRKSVPRKQGSYVSAHYTTRVTARAIYLKEFSWISKNKLNKIPPKDPQ